MLIDTHCHLGDEQFDADRNEVVGRAVRAGVGHVIIVADSLAAADRCMALAEELHLSATAGVHPHSASSWNAEARDRLVETLSNPVVVAVGETGLDYHYDHSPRDIQRKAFEAHLAVAAEHGKPVVVHARDADEDMAAALSGIAGSVEVILHSFSSGPAVFEAGLASRAYFSFSGMLTFRSWTQDDFVTDCPADRLLVETDAPYLAPYPYSGKRNEQAYIVRTAQRMAQLRGETLEGIAGLTSANARRCFGERVLISGRIEK